MIQLAAPTIFTRLTVTVKVTSEICISSGFNYSTWGNVLRPNSQTAIGPIPEAIKHLTRLQHVILSSNRINGAVPAFFAEMSLLTLDLSINLFNSFDPNMIGTNLSLSLQTLNLRSAINPVGPSNGVTLPLRFNDLSAVVSVNLESNRLGGALPVLKVLSSLVSFNAPFNAFSGNLPVQCGPNTQILMLHNNAFNGTIPDFSTCLQLQTLRFSFNLMTGTIPSTITLLRNLAVLWIGFNQFTGPMPDISTLTMLNTLSISSLKLTGPAPNARTLPFLQIYSIHTNSFTGATPDMSINTVLNTFLIHNNFFSGPFVNLAGSRNFANVTACAIFPGNNALCTDDNNLSPPAICVTSNGNTAPLQPCSSCTTANNVILKNTCTSIACINAAVGRSMALSFTSALSGCTATNIDSALCNCTVIEATELCSMSLCLTTYGSGIAGPTTTQYAQRRKCLVDRTRYVGVGCPAVTTDIYDNSAGLCSTTVNTLTACFDSSADGINACIAEVGKRNRALSCASILNNAPSTTCNCPYLDANIICGKYYCDTFDTNCMKNLIIQYTTSSIGNCQTANVTTVWTNHFPFCKSSSDTIRQCTRNPSVLATINSCIANATVSVYGKTCAELIDLKLACYQSYCPLHDSQCLRSSLLSTECSVLTECTNAVTLANLPYGCANEIKTTSVCACPVVDAVTVCGAQLCNPLDVDCLRPKTVNYTLASMICAAQPVNTTVFTNHSPYCAYSNKVVQACNSTMRDNIKTCYSNLFTANAGKNCSEIAKLQPACYISSCLKFDLGCLNIQPDCSGVV